MIRAILFDVDGVIFKKSKYKYFSDRFSEEYNVPIEDISPFFRGDYRLCATDQADLKAILPSYLKKWGWKGSVDEFLEYWFSSDCELDERLINGVKKLKAQNILVCLATNNEKYRARYLLETLKLNEIFDKAFVSAFIGKKKPSPEFFEAAMKELEGLNKQEVLFWDSDQENVDGAQEFGIQSRLYTTFEDFEEQMKELNLL